jgi:hypothetical protein
MSRLSRLREYSNPTKGPHGAGRDEKNIDYWSDRAKQNSQLAPRASGIDETVMPHSTGKQTALRDTGMSPLVSRNADRAMKDDDFDRVVSPPRTTRKVDDAMAGKNDLNNTGSSYMRGIRRDA